MFDSEKEPMIVDVVRSMKRVGFSYEEVFDVLTGAGISGGEVQLLLDRVEENFEDAKVESRASRLGKEVEIIFDKKLGEIDIELESKFRTFNRKLEEMNNAIEILENRVSELQRVCCEELPKREEEKNVND